MRVAIIGANGQLGTDLMKVFGKNAIPITHKDLDVTDVDSLKILEELNPDVIINTAAYHKTDECEDNPEKTFNVNTIGALNIARISSRIDAVNVFISTDYVFDGEKGKPYTEKDTPNPINVYGMSKYAGEIFTRNYSSKYYIIRVSSLFGVAGARGKGGNFVETMIRLAKERKEIKVVNDIIMSPTYTRDASIVIKEIIERKLPYGIYHVTNEGYCSWYEFAKKIFEILDWDVTVKPISSDEYKTKAKRPKFSALENYNIKQYDINIEDWENALRNYLDEVHAYNE